MSTALFSPDEAAELADVKPAQLKLWLQTGKFKTNNWSRSQPACLSEPSYFFTEEDVARLVAFAAAQGKRKPRSDSAEVVQSGFFTAAQLAQQWNLSEDVIRKEFENEPGVLKLARKRKGKRPYKTLRIPKDVAERVKRRMSS